MVQHNQGSNTVGSKGSKRRVRREIKNVILISCDGGSVIPTLNYYATKFAIKSRRGYNSLQPYVDIIKKRITIPEKNVMI